MVVLKKLIKKLTKEKPVIMGKIKIINIDISIQSDKILTELNRTYIWKGDFGYGNEY